jgi:transposase
MASISPEQKEQVISLVREDSLSNDEIAIRVGVSRGTVSAIKAHFTRGSYGAPAATDAETDELIEAAETTFGLERDMQRALRTNIEQLERGLRIVDGGRERSTDAGRIDIVAQDEAGKTVVIELKAGVAPPEALTQLLAYMGATASEPVGVRGILVAEDFHPRLKFAARAVPNVQLRRYRYQFSFESVD